MEHNVEKLYVANLGGVGETEPEKILFSDVVLYSEPVNTSHEQALFHTPKFLNIAPGNESFEVVLEPWQEETGLYCVEK